MVAHAGYLEGDGRMSYRTWKHDELMTDLGGHLVAQSRMIWTDMQLGPQGSPRPDVYTIERSFMRPNPTAFEVKVSVSDFRADVTTAKWSRYLEYAHAVVFACPAGMLTKADVPEQCGLIVRSETGWRYAKKAVVNPRPIAQAALLKLLIDGVTREGPVMRAMRWRDPGRDFAVKFGSEAARYVADAATTHQRLENTRAQAEQIIQQARIEADRVRKMENIEASELWRALLEALELKPDANVWDVRRAVASVKRQAVGGDEKHSLNVLVGEIERLVGRYKISAGVV